MRAPIIYVLLLAAAGCQSETTRFTSEEDACSFAELSGWSASRDRDSLLLRDPGSRATITIRTVRSVNDWVEERTPALVGPAVEKTLHALPQSVVIGPAPVRADLDGASFEVTFVPQGKHERYLRRHVVFYGEETGKVFHVVLTVPANAAEPATKAFDRVVDSFQEV